MKVNLSSYLERQKYLTRKIVKELSKDFKYVSILGADTTGKRYSVQRTGCGINDSNWSERGFVVRVFNGINYSEYSFNDLSEDNYDEIIQNIKITATQELEKIKKESVNISSYPIIDEGELKKSMYGEVEILPEEVSAEEKINRMTKLMNKALEVSDLLVDFRVMYEEVKVSKIFESTKKSLDQSYIFTTALVVPIVKREETIKYSFKPFSGLHGVEILDKLEGGYKGVIEECIKLLDASRVEPGEYEIICDPDVAGLIAHEAFGHGVEMDMFVKNRAKGMEYIGKKVASDKVVMHDGATAANEVGTYLFDDEGTLGTDTVIIKDSLLQTGISDLLSAMKLGTQPTGNGRRESFERKAYARMTNTFFSAGNDTLEDMIASIEKGYLLEGYFSGMEDPKNWGIQCMIAKGKEIINGKLTGKVVSPVLLTGYVPDLLNSVSMVSDGLVLSGSGACGKGHKEFVKTSTGGSYIKAIGRLG